MKQRWKEILIIAWPLIVANSFWQIQMTVDRVFLGQYSTEALGAAMAVMGVFWVPMALLQQTASYVTTFVAQYSGAERNERVGASFWQAIFVSLFGGLFFLLLNIFSQDFFQLLGHSSLMQQLEIEYFNSVSYSALPAALVAAISGYFTGLGKTKVVIQINFIGMLLNIILDYLFIFGNAGFPEWGVAGAGYATALANLGAAIWGFYLVLKSSDSLIFKIRQTIRFDFLLMKDFLKFGLPSGAQWALEGLAFTVFLIIMGRLPNGEAALASSSLAVTVMMLTVLPSMGIAQAVMTIMGHSIGDQNFAKAERATWDGVQITAIYIATAAMTFVLFPYFYISWFENDQNPALWAQVLEITPHLLKIVSVFVIFDSLYLNLSFALKGAGDTRFVSLIALVLPWPFMVLPAYLVKDLENGLILAWTGTILYSIAICSCLLWRFRTNKWMKMSVMSPNPK